jgi:hypothetical protein
MAAAMPDARLLAAPAAFDTGAHPDPPGAVVMRDAAIVAEGCQAAADMPIDVRSASETLFVPRGIIRWHWVSDASGYTMGQGNLSITTRGLVRIGELGRSNRRCDGEPLVRANYPREPLRSHVDIAADDPCTDGQGDFGYSKTHQVDGTAVCVSFASGNGGSMTDIVDAHGLVVAIT